MSEQRRLSEETLAAIEAIGKDEDFGNIAELSSQNTALANAAVAFAIQKLQLNEPPSFETVNYGEHFKITHTEGDREVKNLDTQQLEAVLECAAEVPLILEHTGWIEELENNLFFKCFLGRKVDIFPGFEGKEPIKDHVEFSLNSWRVIWRNQVADATSYSGEDEISEEKKQSKNNKMAYGPDSLLNPILRSNVQDAPFVPNHPNIERASALVRKQAKHMVDKCAQLGKSLSEELLYHSMMYTLRKNLEAFNQCEIIRFSPQHLSVIELHGKHWDGEQWQRHHQVTKTPDGKMIRVQHRRLPSERRVLFSPQEIRDFFSDIKEELACGTIADKKEASIKFLKKVNAFPEGSDFNDITREIRRAHAFLENVINLADEIDKDEFKPTNGSLDSMSRKRISIAARLHEKNLFELLEMIYDKDVRKTYLERGDRRTLIEAAIMSGIFALFWSTHYHPINKKQNDLIKQLNSSLDRITDTQELETIYVPMLEYKDGKYTHTHYDTLEGYRLNRKITAKALETDDPEEIAIYTPMISIEEAKPKGVEQSTDKMSGKSPDKRLEDITDSKRARLMVNWTSDEVRKDPKKRDILFETLKSIANDLNLGDPKINSSKPLEVSHRKQWFADGELQQEPRSDIRDDSGKHYAKMKLTGYNHEGGMVEVQIIFMDTYAFDHAKDSPISHENLEMLRPLRQIKKQLYASEYGTALHAAADKHIAAIEEGQQLSQKGQIEFLETSANFNNLENFEEARNRMQMKIAA